MRKFRSPTPNRKGEFEEHVVPERKVPSLLARGWTEVLPDADDTEKESAKSGQQMKSSDQPLTGSLNDRPVFEMGGSWMKTRARVRDELGLDYVPKDKEEARVLLEDAGYEVQ